MLKRSGVAIELFRPGVVVMEMGEDILKNQSVNSTDDRFCWDQPFVGHQLHHSLRLMRLSYKAY